MIGLVYCMEFLEANLHWLEEKMVSYKGIFNKNMFNPSLDYYFLFDCPGQVELYTHHKSMRNIVEKLQKLDFRVLNFIYF